MAFSHIKAVNFRNFNAITVDVSAGDVVFYGENGQGKTNFLEAVYMLCYGSSFRTRTEKNLFRFGTDFFSLAGSYSDDDGLPHSVKMILKESKKQILLNGKAISDRKELIYRNPCIIFAHDDIVFVNGSPERKRWFMNQTISLFDPLFLELWRRYAYILKSRNKALREESYSLLETLNIQLVRAGMEIIRKRKVLLEEFSRTFEPAFRNVSGIKEVVLKYQSSWPSESREEDILEYLGGIADREKRRKTSLSGPHRDKYVFRKEGRDFVVTASTGQLRLMALALRASQAVFYREKSGRKPILLLDDVLLELDPDKRKGFLEQLPEYEQAFYTFLPDEKMINLKTQSRILYRVEEGLFLKQ